MNRRHVLGRDELIDASGDRKFTLDVYILTNTASLDHWIQNAGHSASLLSLTYLGIFLFIASSTAS